MRNWIFRRQSDVFEHGGGTRQNLYIQDGFGCPRNWTHGWTPIRSRPTMAMPSADRHPDEIARGHRAKLRPGLVLELSKLGEDF